jgi:hypothetical protein
LARVSAFSISRVEYQRIDDNVALEILMDMIAVISGDETIAKAAQLISNLSL